MRISAYVLSVCVFTFCYSDLLLIVSICFGVVIRLLILCTYDLLVYFIDMLIVDT